tara:strand:+ start:545 stop:727 length:183 start_codon:yes stop_codon:yes gene_type:complete
MISEQLLQFERRNLIFRIAQEFLSHKNEMMRDDNVILFRNITEIQREQIREEIDDEILLS